MQAEQRQQSKFHVDVVERNFIMLAIGLLIVFAISVAVGNLAYNIGVPEPVAVVDPTKLNEHPQFGRPIEERVRELSPGKYEAYIIASAGVQTAADTAGAWTFSPGSSNLGGPGPIRIPKGSTITFYVTSADIQHGFKLLDTNISFMVLPGQISKLTATFDDPGTYKFICYEYCGSAHHKMFGELIVEE